MNNNFNLLREKYPTIKYSKYDFKTFNDKLIITYTFEIPNLTTFNPSIQIPLKNQTISLTDPLLNNLIFHIGVVELIRYFKCTCSPNIIIEAGYLNEEQIKQIKEAGVERFNHNINTSQNYHNEICTTHHFEDRIKTVKNIVKNGIEACTGVILGMGETKEDRVDMALSLAELNPKTVPINVLNPIKGTPLEDYSDKITEEDVIRTICIFRIAMPKAILRYAGGRNTRLSLETQKLGLKAGVNGLLAGDYLTTNGEEVQKDKEMLESIDLEFSKE